ncbi:MAG: hypothetical protein ACLQVX_14415 [Limisphaerales bacterium]
MLAVESKPSAAGNPPSRPLPPESGECMHSREFLRRYEQMPDAQGVLHSRGFPGLCLPLAPLLACDTAKVLDALTEREPRDGKSPETSVHSGG